MRLAYLCADFGIPIRGHKGASVHVRELVAALRAQGHDVRVFSPYPGTGNAIDAPLHHIGWEGLPAACARLARHVPGRHPRLDKEIRELAYNVTLYRGLRAQCRLWRPEAVYERYSLYGLAGLALAQWGGVPHVLEVNAPLRLERARTRGVALPPIARCVERHVFRGSDAVLTVSTALRRYALAHGARPARTHVMSNAVDTVRFQPGSARDAVRARLGLPADALVIGFAGSLKPWHGTDVLLAAYAALRAAPRETRLLIVGDGPQGAVLRAAVRRLGLEGSVLFTGAVTHDAMPGLLAAMDVGVAPYLDVPAFYFSPLKLYEYMAAGLAVVASDAGEIAGLVREGETGLLCRPGDVAGLTAALARLMCDSDLRLHLGRAARVDAERHTWAANARTVTTLVTTLAADRRRPATSASTDRGHG